MKFETCDFLVVGSGLAGLTYALRAAEHGQVCVLTKGEIFESNTNYAQGGIAAAMDEADSWQLHEEDTLSAGAGIGDPDAVRFLVQKAPEAIRWLVSLGVNFDLGSDGDLALGREGGHSRNRIVHHADKTGWEIERAVIEAVRKHSAIKVYERAFVTSLIEENSACVGAEAQIEGIGKRRFYGRATMLTTGGCGRMYQHTTNPAVATGDGIALGAEMGARIANMEFMQFHPTTLYHPQMRSFLISEAVRGAGGTLRNHLGRRFMYDYDPRLELAPRDVVARAIDAEMKRLATWCVYLDVTHLPKEQIEREFPTIYERLAAIDLHMERDWIPVVPAQHYSCGGVVTDLAGRTTVARLYAAGEVASTGVHGANRLASNSLLEALVFASSAADASAAEPGIEAGRGTVRAKKSVSEAESVRIRRALGRAMTQGAGIVRTFQALHDGLDTIRLLQAQYDELPRAPFSSHPLETRNLLTAAEFVVRGALERKDNVGLHFNADLASAPSPNSSGQERPLAVSSPISET